MTSEADPVNIATRYDFAGLGSDVSEILDLPTAVLGVVRWVIIIPLVTSLVFWMTFTDRLAGWAVFLFTVTALVSCLVASVLFGTYFVIRQRLADCRQASTRVVETIGAVHQDLVRIGGSDVSHSLISETVAAFFDGPFIDETVVPFLPGPLRLIGKPLVKPVLWAPKRVVRRTVTAAIESMPWEQLDRRTKEVTERVGLAGEAAEGIGHDYDRAIGRIDTVAARIESITSTPILVLFVVALVPVFGLYLFGLAVA